MLRKSILTCAVAIIAVVYFIFAGEGKDALVTATKQVGTGLTRLNTISVPETGNTRDEMLRRFGRAHALIMEYDKELQTDVTRFYYRIDDSDLFMEFVSDWNQKQNIVDFSMKEGYYMLNFTNYGN